MKNLELENVVEISNENARLEMGGYTVRITEVKDCPEKEYLIIYYDIASGPYKGYYKKLFDNFNFWGGVLYRSYKDSALGFFKKFISCVEQSNSGYKFNYKEQTLCNKVFGAVLQEEEYINNSGEIKTRLAVSDVCTISDIAIKNYMKPELKKLSEEKRAQKTFTDTFSAVETTSLDDEDLPF